MSVMQASDAGVWLTAQLASIDGVSGTRSTLEEGVHTVVYNVTDAAGNTNKCPFTVAAKGW